MNLLWIVNTVFPGPSDAMGLPTPIFGGWMYGLAERLAKNDEIKLAVATVYKGSELKKLSIANIEYYLLPCDNKNKYDHNLELFWREILEIFRPDIVHIHGTEYPHGLACMRTLPDLNYIISIQGLVSVIEKFYLGGISFRDVLKNITLRDILKGETLYQARYKMRKRGEYEEEYLKLTNHVMGRTTWDYVHVKALNKNVLYHFCNESLRDNFYHSTKWSYSNCIPYSILVSQAGYPLKGFHQVLKAIILLREEFPNIKVRVGGTDVTNQISFKDKLKISGYHLYLKRMIERHKLSEYVEFLGPLGEKEMTTAYLQSNVFISPSSIENSSNSIGESQLLGVPTIASYVGGNMDLIEDGNTGVLYRFEDIKMLAFQIRSIFTNVNKAQDLSKNGIVVASKRHNRNANFNSLMKIYKIIK